jgi:hypothetical protein
MGIFGNIFNNIKKTKNISLKTILIIMAIGIWAIMLQNAGVLPTNQNVRVVNEVDAYVRGDVSVDGSVSIDNTVDVNIKKINGSKPSTYSNGLLGVYDPYQN